MILLTATLGCATNNPLSHSTSVESQAPYGSSSTSAMLSSLLSLLVRSFSGWRRSCQHSKPGDKSNHRKHRPNPPCPLHFQECTSPRRREIDLRYCTNNVCLRSHLHTKSHPLLITISLPQAHCQHSTTPSMCFAEKFIASTRQR
jgi:hypothetical protein